METFRLRGCFATRSSPRYDELYRGSKREIHRFAKNTFDSCITLAVRSVMVLVALFLSPVT